MKWFAVVAIGSALVSIAGAIAAVFIARSSELPQRPCPTTHETVYQYGCGTR
jgi:hypothetical protein